MKNLSYMLAFNYPRYLVVVMNESVGADTIILHVAAPPGASCHQCQILGQLQPLVLPVGL